MERFERVASREYTPADLMTCVMSRLISNGESVFHGVSSHMPLVATLLAKQLHAPRAVHLTIPGGVDAETVKLSGYTSSGGELCEDAQAMFPLQDVFDFCMKGRLDIAFFSGIQFDGQGNVNASVIGDYRHPKVRMPGGAGCAVMLPTVKRAVLWRSKHDRRTFVNQVDFVTARGNIDRVITPLCVFRFYDGRLELDTVHPFATFEQVQDNTCFPLSRNAVGETPPPTVEEMRLLHTIDPEGLRAIEF